MSGAVVIQVGQCGNQLGESLFSLLYQEMINSSSKQFSEAVKRRFFSAGEWSLGKEGSVPTANAVLIDMENKVVDKLLECPRPWGYYHRACVSAKQGSGNNWANGYYNYGSTREEDIEEAIKAISDLIPSIDTVLILMSSAGGTGSGLGCKITEIARGVIPGALIINQVVLPFGSGEVAVQGYNTLLTLSSLYRTSDSILLVHNDSYQALSRRLLAGGNKKSVSFDEMNRLIASHTAGVLLPSYQLTTESTAENAAASKELEESSSSRQDKLQSSTLIGLDTVLEHLVPHPCYKLLSCRMMPIVSEISRNYTNTSWEMLGKYSRQMLMQDSIMDEGLIWSIKPRSELTTLNKRVKLNISISNVVVCRGTSHPITEIEEKFSVADLYRGGNTRCMFGYASPQYEKLDKSLMVMSNASCNGAFLEDLLKDTWVKFRAGAFLHQYEQYGVDKQWFQDSLNIIEKVNQDYREIC